MLFIRDEAPAHFDRVVRDHLNKQFHQRWIGRGGSLSWPSRSPDLTPIDFYLWGHLKTVVYATPMNDAENLCERVQNACQVIRDDNMVFERIRQSCVRRAQACVQNGGRQIEQLL
jgi:hypothetical protein